MGDDLALTLELIASIDRRLEETRDPGERWFLLDLRFQLDREIVPPEEVAA